jgi:hypothetical protein
VPYVAGPGADVAAPGGLNLASGSAVADRGGQAIGTLIYQRQPEATAMPVRLTPRPTVLTGREALLAEIDGRLAAALGRAGPQLVVLCGLGGAGKTSVAVEYAHRRLGTVGVCWQFAAEDPVVLATQFGVLAAQLGARDLADTRDPVAAVHAVLARAQSGWLLVFDNAPDLAAVEAFLPPAGPGHVLITSQRQHWPAGWAVQVPVLETEVAAQFLAARTGDPNQGAALELAEELGGLPLALEQAAAYIQAVGTSLAGYLVLFRARQADLLSRGEAAGHREHVAATLGLAQARQDQDAPTATVLLQLLAFLAPEPVPLGLLLAEQENQAKLLATGTAKELGPLLGDPLAVADAVAALRRYSLAAPAGEGLVRVHRLVQAVTRAQLTPEEAERWQQAAAALVDAALPADGELPAAWPTCALLMPHAVAVLDLTSGGIREVVRSVGYSGSYAAARDLYTLIADAYRDSDGYGPEHSDTLAARASLARWTGTAGDAAEAHDQFAALLPANERVLGLEHPATLAARASLAYWAGVAGNAAEARDQYAALLPIRQRILGPEHPHTLATRAHLAHWTGVTGAAAAARDELDTLLPLRDRVLGSEHPDTLATRASLARWTGVAGDAAGARDQYAALLSTRQRILGPEHPHTLATSANLAYWAGEAGDAVGARDQYAALLPTRERILGSEHPEILIARANLARWTGEAGNPAEARDQFAALVPIRERVLGPEHPRVLISRAYLARWTGEAGNPAEARDQFAALVPIRERVLGPEHPHTMATRAALAYWTEQAMTTGPDALLEALNSELFADLARTWSGRCCWTRAPTSGRSPLTTGAARGRRKPRAPALGRRRDLARSRRDGRRGCCPGGGPFVPELGLLLLVPWVWVLQGVDDGGFVGVECGREGVDGAVDLDGCRAQRSQGSQDPADRLAGAVLHGTGDGERGEHDGQVRFDRVAGAREHGPGGEVCLGHAERLLDVYVGSRWCLMRRSII